MKLHSDSTKTNRSTLKSDLQRGSLSGALQVVLATVLVLLTIPLFIRVLGKDAWGVFSVITLVGSANTFANLGLNAALVRFLSAQGKSEESDHDIAVTLLLLLTIILPLTILGFVFERFILSNVLNVPPEMLGDAAWLYRSMLVCNIFVLAGQTLTAVLDAQQKVHLTNICQMVYAVLYWGLILAVILLRLPLKAMGLTILISTVVWFAAAAASMVSTWGWPSLTGMRPHFFRLARKQLTYGLQLFSAGLIGFFYEPLAKILIANYLGIRDVGVFEIGLRARNLVTSLVLKLLYPLYPLLSSRTDHEGIRSLVHDVELKLLLLAAPITGIMVLATTSMVALFFEATMDLLPATIMWMVSSYLFASVTITPFYQFLMAKGFASRTVFVQLVNVITSAVVFFASFSFLGYFAAVAGNVVANGLTWLLLYWYQRRYLNIGVFDNWRQAGAVLIVAGIPVCVGTVLSFPDAGVWGVLVPPVAVGLLAVFTYRLSGIVGVKDVSRYLGENTRAANLCVRLLCKDPSPTLPSQGG